MVGSGTGTGTVTVQPSDLVMVVNVSVSASVGKIGISVTKLKDAMIFPSFSSLSPSPGVGTVVMVALG